MANDALVRKQYEAATRNAAVAVRGGCGLIEIRGRDRATWLNNLITNVVKTLAAGEGNYFFATNVKGRVMFDGNVLALEDRLWIDLDRRIVGTALGHLNRYLITEDAQPIDVSERFGRLAIIGPEAGAVVSGLGLGNLAPMAQLQHVQGEVDGAPVRLVRHDFCGLPAAELIVPSESVGAVQASIGRIGGGAVAEIGASTLEVLRVEAGRPASVEDIDEGVLPPETLQVERGISYHKGCYLGQEVIERMRSRGSLARQLVGIRLGGDAVPARGTVVQTDGKDVGRVTSGVWSEALGAVLVLGYVKTAYAAAGTAVAVVVGEDAVAGEVVPLPVGRG